MGTRAVLALSAAACAAALFWRLGSPGLWQDEAETAMLGRSILAHGVPAVRLGSQTITVEPRLRDAEARDGVFIWNTWLPLYAAAGSFAVLGRSALAARLPFALAAFAAFLLYIRLVRDLDADDEGWAGLAAAWLACCVPWLLLMRQCRYYALACLGTLGAVSAYRALLKGRRRAGLWLGASLLLLLHSSFGYCPIVAAALAADATLRRGEADFQRRFWATLAVVAVPSAPAAWYFRMWSRPGNHAYPPAESPRFLRTFLLWSCAFIVPAPLLAARIAFLRRPGVRQAALAAAACVAFLALLAREGFTADAAALAALAAMIAAALRAPAPAGELGLGRLTLLLSAAALAVFSWGGAEPYGRYLGALLPLACLACARWAFEVSRGRRTAAWAVFAVCATSNLAFVAPLRVACWLGRPAPAETVSGMMRERLRDLGPRPDLASFWSELVRGPSGYVEAVAERIRRDPSPGGTLFSDQDSMSLAFHAGLRALLPDELDAEAPDWIVPSPWLSLDAPVSARLERLLKTSPYERVDLEAPRLLWQNNPDILFHTFRPAYGPMTVFRLRRGGRRSDGF